MPNFGVVKDICLVTSLFTCALLSGCIGASKTPNSLPTQTLPVRYFLAPDGIETDIGPPKSYLGSTALNDAALYYKTVKDARQPTVEPEFVDGKLSNADKIKPARLLIIPDAITIPVSYISNSSATNDLRKAKQLITGPSIKNASSEAAFVYAYNDAGALISPFYQRGGGGTYKPTLEIMLTGGHFNRSYFYQPLVAASEVDGVITEAYSPQNPLANLMHGIMFRARQSGLYAVGVNVRLARDLFPDENRPESAPYKDVMNRVVTDAVKVEARDDLLLIDRLLVELDKTDISTQDTNGKLSIGLKKGDAVVLNLSGRIAHYEWDDVSLKYIEFSSEDVSLSSAEWIFSPANKEATNREIRLTIQKLTGDGTSVRLIGGEPLPITPSNPKPSIYVGDLEIRTHGRSFSITIHILP